MKNVKRKIRQNNEENDHKTKNREDQKIEKTKNSLEIKGFFILKNFRQSAQKIKRKRMKNRE